MLTAIPKLGRHISVTHVIDKFKVVGSIARAMLNKALEAGSIRNVEKHSKQALFTPTAAPEKPAAVVETKETGKKGKKK